ncbi:MAG: sensor histidine kinase [bacterium]
MEYKSIKGLRYFLFVFLGLLIVADIIAYFVFVNIIKSSGEEYKNDRYSTVNSFIESTKKRFDLYSNSIDFINKEQDIIRKSISERNVYSYYLTDSTLFPIIVSKSFKFDQKYIRNFFMPILKDNLSMRYFIDNYEIYSFKIENKNRNVIFAVFAFETGSGYMNRIMLYFFIYRTIILIFILIFSAFLLFSIEKPLRSISNIAQSLKIRINPNDQGNIVKVFSDSMEEILKKQREDEDAMDALLIKYKKMEDDFLSKEGLLKLSEITNGIAHQLNNQLGGITGLMQAAERSNDVSLYREAYNQLKVLSDFTKKFLEFAGSTKPYFSDVDIAEVVERTALRHEVSIKGNLNGTIVKSDNHLLEQIFINLFDNISKYSKKREADVELREIPNKIILKVTDGGEGYPESVLKNLYNPFSETSHGYGLGIPTVVKLASILNHAVEFRNEDKRGVFEITFIKEVE